MHSAHGEPAPAGAVVMLPRSPELRPLVASFSQVTAGSSTAPEAALQRILPAGRIHLMVNLHEDEFRTYHGPGSAAVRRTRGAVLEGPHSQPRVIDTRMRCLVSVEFRFGGAAPFVGPPLSEVRDQLVDLEQLWGRGARDLRERLLEAPTPEGKRDVLEAALLDRLARPPTTDPAMLHAAALLERGSPVSEVSARVGLLPKTFVRRFREHTGLAPKRFARVRRLQRVLASSGDPGAVDWADLAARHGYADQSHFIHDFRDLTGLAPTAYWPDTGRERNHVPVAPARG